MAARPWKFESSPGHHPPPPAGGRGASRIGATLPGSGPLIELHRFDLPDGVGFGDAVAVDTETMGLDPHRDRLCLVQRSAGDGSAHLVLFPEPGFQAPNLKALLEDKGVT